MQLLNLADKCARQEQCRGRLSFTYCQLMWKFSQRHPWMRHQLYRTGDHGNKTLLSNNQELQKAFRDSTDKPLQLEVFSEYLDLARLFHPEITCCFCHYIISGKRYVCTSCIDVVFCCGCENKGCHSEHPAIRLVYPSAMSHSRKEPRMSPSFRTDLHLQPCYWTAPEFLYIPSMLDVMENLFRTLSSTCSKLEKTIETASCTRVYYKCEHLCHVAKTSVTHAREVLAEPETKKQSEDAFKDMYV